MKSVVDLIKTISRSGISSLSYDDPRIKISLIFAILTPLLKCKSGLQYIDLDLQFSSMLQNLPSMQRSSFSEIDLRIVRPEKDPLEFLILGPSSPRGLIVLDTLNTLQNLFTTTSTTMLANHKTSIVISMLQEIARHQSKGLLILNLTRSRPVKKGDEILWGKEIVGGRMIHFKSDVTYFAHEEPIVDSALDRNIIIETVRPESSPKEEFLVELQRKYQPPFT